MAKTARIDTPPPLVALDTNPDLLLSAFLRMVRRLYSDVAAQTSWLDALQQQALIGSATGIADVLANLQDYSAAAVSNEGASTQWLRELSAPIIAQLCEAALQRIEADDASGGTGKAPPGNLRYADFSSAPSTLG